MPNTPSSAPDRNCRVFILCCDGLYQRDLVARAAEQFDLVGVVLHQPVNPAASLLARLRRYANPVTLLRQLQARRLMKGYTIQAQPLLQELFFRAGSPPQLPPGVPVLEVEDINSPAAVQFVREKAPEVVLVNGTNLLRQPMLDLLPGIPHGIINLHTGLSPYSRGGNCNLYMLLEGHPELVGITIHHIDRGIDSGDIILTARPDMQPGDNYEMIDAKTFRLGNDKLLEAVRWLKAGKAERVRQWEEGKLFLRRTGYVYEPWQRVQVNRLLSSGLIADYLANQASVDRNVRLVDARA